MEVQDMVDLADVYFLSLFGAPMLGFGLGAIVDSHWGQRRRARKLPYGDQRVEILEHVWGLERLQKRINDPDHKISRAIEQCYLALADIDHAVLLTHQAEIDEAVKQGWFATAVLEATKETLQKSTSLRPPVLEAAPAQKSSVPTAARTHA
jgi:hypothetical protein